MSLSERFLRISCNELQENKINSEKLKYVINFLKEPLLLQKSQEGRKYKRRNVASETGEFSFKVNENSELTVSDDDSGEHSLIKLNSRIL